MLFIEHENRCDYDNSPALVHALEEKLAYSTRGSKLLRHIYVI